MENNRNGEVIGANELEIPIAEEVIRRREQFRENMPDGMELEATLPFMNADGEEEKSKINPDSINSINPGPTQGTYEVLIEKEDNGKKNLVKIITIGAGLITLAATLKYVSKNRKK